VSYYLYDSRGYVADGPSIMGWEDFVAWAPASVQPFIEAGHTTDLDALITALESMTTSDPNVDSTRVAILDAARQAEDVLILSDGMGLDDELKTAGGPGSGPRTMYHGGTAEHAAAVTYYTPNKDMAQSYVDMSNDRFGTGGALHEAQVDIKSPAPQEVITREAAKLGIDNGFYTPASVFDAELHGQHEVNQLVRRLGQLGYDGAVLKDIAYGKNIEDDAHIVFKPKIRTAAGRTDPTPIHAVADSFQRQFHLAVMYGFFKGRKAVDKAALQSATTAGQAAAAMARVPKTVKLALHEVLPKLLLKIVGEAGQAGIDMLRPALARAAGGPGSGPRSKYSTKELYDAAQKAGEKLFGTKEVGGLIFVKGNTPPEYANLSTVPAAESAKADALSGKKNDPAVDDFEYVFHPSSGKGLDVSGSSLREDASKSWVDKDGKIYLYSGTNGTIRVINVDVPLGRPPGAGPKVENPPELLRGPRGSVLVLREPSDKGDYKYTVKAGNETHVIEGKSTFDQMEKLVKKYTGLKTLGGPGSGPHPMGPRNDKGEAAQFVAHMPTGDPADPGLALYNIDGGPSHMSTVSVDTLVKMGIEIPPTPAYDEKQAKKDADALKRQAYARLAGLSLRTAAGEAGTSADLPLTDSAIDALGLRGTRRFRAAKDPVDPLSMAFNVADQNAVDWADQHAGELIDGITETTRQDIADAIAGALDGGDIGSAYQDILDAVGNEDRADMIARTETMDAANSGLAQSWSQAADAGLLSGNELKEWIATSGACDDCEYMDGEQVPLDDDFSIGDDPPAHPNCRCTLGIAYDSGEE
jgi:hypothetical protein